MESWGFLDDKSESELHKARLFSVEEKPFKRITKRVGTVASLLPSGPDSKSLHQNGSQPPQPSNLEQLKEDFTLDFAAFDSSITRLQFLLDANARERARYQADQERIVSECQSVRDNNAQLREQLDAAKATLAQRKKFDELAEKITSNRLLRPREDQVANLSKLEEECRELERESETYSETWNERRNQFNRIMEEGMLLRRQIRDEKEEVDRREGMDEGGEDEDEGDKGGRTPRHEPSGSNTPRPDGDSQSKAGGEAGTPRLEPSVVTPQGDGDTPVPDTDQGTAAGQDDAHLRPDSSGQSRDVTPVSQGEESKETGKDDVEMEDPGQTRTKVTDEGGDDMPAAQTSADASEANGDQMEVDS